MKKLYSLAITLLIASIGLAQSGQKWATGGNGLSSNDFLGSTNNYPLIFKVNNYQYLSIGTNGVVQINQLSGSGTRFLQSDANGNMIAFPMGTTSQVLYGNGTWGALPMQPWVFSGSNISYLAGSTSVAALTAASLNVIGNTTLQGNVTVTGNKAVNGSFSVLGNSTVAGLTAANLAVTGNSIFVGNIRNNTLAGTGNRILQTDASGNITALTEGTATQVLYGNGIWGSLPTAPSSVWNSSGNTIYYNGGTVGINNTNPNTAYALDVNGDAHVTNLYADQSVVIGNVSATKDVVAGKVNSDTIYTSEPSQKITVMQNVDARSDINAAGNVNVTNALNVTGNAAFVNSVDVGQKLTFKGGQGTIGYAAPGTALPTPTPDAGNFVLSSNTSVWGDLNITGASQFYGNTTVSGSLTTNSLSISSLSGNSGGGFVTVDSLGNLVASKVNPGIGGGFNSTILHCITQTPWMIGGNTLGSITNAVIGTCDNHDFVLQAYSTPYLWLKPTGLFGVGNSSPTAMLDITTSGTNQCFNVNNSSGSIFNIANDGTTVINNQLGIGGSPSTGSMLEINPTGSLSGFAINSTSGSPVFSVGADGHTEITKLTLPPSLSVLLKFQTLNSGASYNTPFQLWSDGSTLINSYATTDNTPLIVTGSSSTSFVASFANPGGVGYSTNFLSKAKTNALYNSLVKINDNAIIWDNGTHGGTQTTGFVIGAYNGGGGIRVDGATGNVNILTSANSASTSSPFVITSTTQTQFPDAPVPKLFEITYNGQAYVRELFVKITQFPDYVFKSEYKLMPLSELEKYYQTNHHLPEVPSEKEVQEKGMNVGEMNALLLKKVEELTLYIVDLKKEVEGLKKSNNK